LRSVGRQITDVARGLPLGSLRDDHVVALNAVGREVVVSEGGRGSHAHGGHCLLLGDGRLALLVGPVAADGTRSKPLSVHGAECALSIGAIPKGNEAVSARPARLHVPHDASFRNRTEGREGLEKDFIVDLVGQVADENVEVVGRVFLGGVVRLVSPIDADFLTESVPMRTCAAMRARAYVVVDATPVERRHPSLGRARVVVLDETIVETLGVHLLAVVPCVFCNECRMDPDCAACHRGARAARLAVYLTDGELTVLSGIILTLWTCPVVSKI
jgi:hypothetical protein